MPRLSRLWQIAVASACAGGGAMGGAMVGAMGGALTGALVGAVGVDAHAVTTSKVQERPATHRGGTTGRARSSVIRDVGDAGTRLWVAADTE